MKSYPATELLLELKSASNIPKTATEPKYITVKRVSRFGNLRNYRVIRQPTIREFIDSFNKRVEKKGPDECWIWTGPTKGKEGNRYGRVGRFKRYHLAHRVAYMIAHLVDPHPECVCHTCDNPLCMNPNHHFLGTKEVNNKDRATKGRSRPRRGEECPNSTFTESDIVAIRLIRKEMGGSRGMYPRLLSMYPHSNKGTLQDIVRGKTWRHVE